MRSDPGQVSGQTLDRSDPEQKPRFEPKCPAEQDYMKSIVRFLIVLMLRLTTNLGASV